MENVLILEFTVPQSSNSLIDLCAPVVVKMKCETLDPFYRLSPRKRNFVVTEGVILLL